MKTPYLFHYTTLKTFLLGSFLILLIASGCTKKNDQELFLSSLMELKSSGKQVLLFVPLDGCGTCIEHSRDFVNEKLLTNDFLKVYVYSLYNKKYLQFDSLVVKSDRFVKDQDSKILSALKVEQKPRVIFLQDGKIVEDLFYDNATDTEIFEKIMKF